jgi:DNA-binding response OmpR family regulator
MSYRLLLIEDSPTQLLTIRHRLESEGFSVMSAQGGAEGIALAYKEMPDLIISDVVMSGINGYQLCRLVKHDPELSDTPVILLTKLDGSIDRFWGLKSGADRYIPKEPGFNSLLQAIREILGEAVERPKLRALGDPNQSLSAEEINGRLHQLLERLLFEATITDEVRRIGEDILDLEIISEKLFALLSSAFDYLAAVLVVNHGAQSKLMLDLSRDSEENEVKAYAARLAMQLGLPPLWEDAPKPAENFDNALTQPIDIAGMRVGLLIVIPWPGQTYKPGDQKVLRLICEQLSTVLRLYLSHAQRQGTLVGTN